MLDLLPVLAFFIVYQQRGLYDATLVLMLATTATTLYHFWRHRSIERHKIAILALLWILGGATLWFQNDTYIKWKPTAVYWIAALFLAVNRMCGKQPLIANFLKLEVAPSTSRTLDNSWIAFLGLMGALNIWIASYYSTDIWVRFKVFGTLGLTSLFIIIQAFILFPKKES